jgi:thiol-disulfide isomerase/thioredoxin
MSLQSLSTRAALLLGLLSISAVPTFAQAGKGDEKPEVKMPALVVGSKAPALSIETWIKGQPVPAFEKGKVYMVEFWATWCAPCVASMPHISELQKKYSAQGLTVIGVSAVDERGNTLEKAQAMVKDKGDTMGYTVAWDKGRETNTAYMEAAEQDGIPCSFLVDQNGVIAYIGHPMKIEKTLESVMANKHDIKALAASYKKQAEIEAQAKEIMEAMNTAGQAEDWPGVIAQMDKLIALDAEQFSGYVGVKFKITASQMSDPAKAYADAKAWFAGAGKENAEAMNAVAWTLVDPQSDLEKPDLDFALDLAQKSNDLTKNENAAMLDTLARVWSLKGDAAKAVDIETKAVAKATDQKMDKRFVKQLQKSLDGYKDDLAKRSKG